MVSLDLDWKISQSLTSCFFGGFFLRFDMRPDVTQCGVRCLPAVAAPCFRQSCDIPLLL